MGGYWTHPGAQCSQPFEEITQAVVHRQLLYDGFNGPEELAGMVGLPPVSAEVAEMELRAHVLRMEQIQPVVPLLLEQSEFLGSTAALLQCLNTDTDPDGENGQAVLLVFTNVIKASLVSAVATAVGLGALSVSREVGVNDVS